MSWEEKKQALRDEMKQIQDNIAAFEAKKQLCIDEKKKCEEDEVREGKITDLVDRTTTDRKLL